MKEEDGGKVLLHFQEWRPGSGMRVRSVYGEIECDDARGVIDKLLELCDDEFGLEITTDAILSDLFGRGD